MACSCASRLIKCVTFNKVSGGTEHSVVVVGYRESIALRNPTGLSATVMARVSANFIVKFV